MTCKRRFLLSNIFAWKLIGVQGARTIRVAVDGDCLLCFFLKK